MRFRYMLKSVLIGSLVCTFLGMMMGCLPFLDLRKSAIFDYKPPFLMDWQVVSSTEVLLNFSEGVMPIQAPEGVQLQVEDGQLKMNYTEAMAPGEEIKSFIIVEDKAKNRLELVLTFYGFNPRVPQLLFNELRLNGSNTRPDMVELIALSDGNLAGSCFYRGVPMDYDFNYVFPSVEVKEGDLIVLHIAPTGEVEEKNEVNNKMESGGIEASENAWDFWLPQKEGLSGTNGVLSVTKAPGGEWMDAIVYSNRNSLSDTNYRGFGSTTNLLRAEACVEVGHWKTPKGGGAEFKIRPEDCVNPSFSTSTRTLCRAPREKGASIEAFDSDSSADWFTVASGECTIGLPNSTNYHQP